MKENDAENVKEILTVVSEKIPELLNSLADILYGREQSKKYGEAVAGFYRSLKESGMTEEQAYELTKQYMSAMNLPGMLGEAMRGRGGRGAGFKFKMKHKGEPHGEEGDEGEDEDDDEDDK